MKVLLATCPNPECNVDQEAVIVTECSFCTPQHADVKCIHCGWRWYEPNPMIYDKPEGSGVGGA